MRRPALLALLAVFALAAFARSATAQSPPPAGGSVVVVKVDGSIDSTQAGYLRDSLDQAEADGATVVIQLDSAGTLDQDAVGLAERIHDARVPVIVWVGPSPAKARGAGLLFMDAASLAAVAPGSGVGPLEPLDLVDARNEMFPSGTELQDLATGWVEERGRPTPLSFPPAPVPAQAALDGNIAQVAAVSVTELLAEVDGMTVTTAAGEVTLHTRIAERETEEPVDVRFTSPGPVDRVLHAAASPAAIYVLLVLGLAGLAFELIQPGFGFAGFAGLASGALGVYGLTVVPFSWLGLLLLVGGVCLMVADVSVRRLGVLTFGGLAAFAAGSFLTFRGVSDLIAVSPWLIGLATTASFLYYGFGLTVAVQSRERITSTQKGLVGLVGETRGELDPDGPVFVKGTLWRGRSQAGPIPTGTRIRVRGVDGLILRVEPEPQTPREPSPTPLQGS
ncbi:MAG TPA: NfeD family protein [Actinomycetota bacterium]|nr:NfeD family protein [Actinomycetota bacterium]